jgi:hypothetical protein
MMVGEPGTEAGHKRRGSMPQFPESDSSYSNVNAIADQQGLIWDGHYGSPYGVEGLIEKELQDPEFTENYSHLFDHTQRFKQRGSGSKKPVLAISSPYQSDDEQLKLDVQAFAKKFGLSARVNDERDRNYTGEGTIPILFWRPDLHELR